MCNQSRAAMTRSDDVHHVEVMPLNQPVQMRVNEIQPGRGSPMPQQARLDVVFDERPLEQRIIPQVDLPNRQVIGGEPIFIELRGFFRGK